MYKHPLLDRDKMTPQEALDILIEGNYRFVNNLTTYKDTQTLVEITKNNFGVMPFSVILVTALSLLELFIAGLQAFIFTFLTAVFIGLAKHRL